MSTETNRATIYRWVEGGWNNGNLDLVDEMYAPDYKIHNPGVEGYPEGAQGFKAFVADFRIGLPDIHFTIEDTVAEGDKVVWRFTVHATHLGPLMGIPPTGKPAVVTGMVISRFTDNGKWEEDYVNWDTFGMLQQFGIIPVPDQQPVGAGKQ
jgi:steroid delta-isomerase-like uncharacterized protein